ncbi:MAG TPA: DUF3800 domain-containing protein [Candidatus Melainabacteria bacterium]|nr:DUF3800 domain-containing protein [Candidatus Melainabacteria bacterium]
MSVLVFLDETGDHSLSTIDPGFPVFVLTMMIVEPDKYINQIVPEVYRLKLDHWGHEGIILHSRDIRKAQGPFAFLRNREKTQPFYERINQVMTESPYTLISIGVRKDRHVTKYGESANNPYELAMEYSLERLVYFLEQQPHKDIILVAESRGKKEDAELQLAFLRIVNNGTYYCTRDRFKPYNFRLEFVTKERNVVGTQLADLAAYPTARWIIDPKKENPAFDIVRPKILRKVDSGYLLGLKIFP